MFMKVTFLILLSRFPYKIGSSNVCVPNSQTVLNGKICSCNSIGHWTEADCYALLRRQICTPGKVIFQGCSRCICQETGLLSCTEDVSCSGPMHYQNIHETLISVLPWCNPFRTYYINCNICICPASGKTLEAKCAQDISCTFYKEPSTAELSSNRSVCIPKVLYLFPCLHCVCSPEGYFNVEKCIETCANKQIETSRRCIPKTLYRKDCNVCLCPDNSIPDDKNCTNNICTYPVSLELLSNLKKKVVKCIPHQFVKPKCIYCDCNPDGNIDERSCLELECLQSEIVRYDVSRESCSPGEVVAFCTECFCTRHGITSDEYCSKSCSVHSKLLVLEKIVNMAKDKSVIDNAAIKRGNSLSVCRQNTIYTENGRYCICTNGISNLNLCTNVDTNLLKKINRTGESHTSIDFSMSCEPNTFVDFDCNSCFCSKNGTIDAKWCTYDDCESKRVIQDSHATETVIPKMADTPLKNVCSPGSIASIECNFCICPDSGSMNDRVCTKNDCTTLTKPAQHSDKFACDPLAYYEVGCNICYCPRDGIKNVAKCTKNHCEKTILRSDVCVPGTLFSDECNVCVCPPNGNKAEKACTNYTCSDPWKKIFQLSESLLSNQMPEDSTRNLDLCFPGEEFISGCKLCVCPDVGLRIYATCSPTFCEEERNMNSVAQELSGSNRDITLHRMLNRRTEDCMLLNFTNKLHRQECTPGSMYIIRCKECICPYMGDISYFCRPMPVGTYCEQAFPGFNFVPMGRRTDKDKSEADAAMNSSVTTAPVTLLIGNKTVFTNSSITSRYSHLSPGLVKHEHTRYECSKRGRIVDECFVCECDGETMIAEHCFQSNATSCADAKPTFFQDYVKSNRSFTSLV